MTLFRSHRLLSRIQRRVNKGILALLALRGIALGLWEAEDWAATTSGYVASYAYPISLFIAVALGILGLLLLIYWRTRSAGAGLIVAGILSYVVFYGCATVLLKQDRVAWRHEEMVSFGPDQKASVVIFRNGVTRQEASDFDRDVLQEPTSRPPGHDRPPFVQVYLRLLPSQANGHEAIALTFSPNAPTDKLNAYLAKIKADERVETVYSNTSPDSIHIGSQRP